MNSQQETIWDSVIELTKLAQHRATDPLTWAVQLSSSLSSAGVSLPSIEAAKLIVDYICWENSVPITWKFLEMALTMKILPPMLVLALLSVRYVLKIVSFCLLHIHYGHVCMCSVYVCVIDFDYCLCRLYNVCACLYEICLS